MQLVLHIIILLITFYLLAVVCDAFFVKSLEKIAKKLKLSSEVTGATFMAVGSSAPELFTSIFALFAIFGSSTGNESIGAGTIVGSAIFNVLVIIGASAIAMKKMKKIARQPVIRDLVFYSLSIILLLVVFWDGQITFVETLFFVGSYILYIFVVKNRSKRLHYEIIDKHQEEEKKLKKNIINRGILKVLSWVIPNPEKGKNGFWFTFTISIIFIAVFSHFMVESAVQTAIILSIPKAIIGLTILAVGTSIPDLISSIIVAKRGKIDMAVSNAVGSNIFDILFGLGFVYFIYILVHGTATTITVDTHNLNSSIILLLATVITMLSLLIIQKRNIKKYIGYLLIGIYILYLGYNIFNVLV